MVEVEAPSPALSSRWNLRGSWLVEVVLDVLPNTGLLPAFMSLSMTDHFLMSKASCLVGLGGIGLGPWFTGFTGFEILLTFSTFC